MTEHGSRTSNRESASARAPRRRSRLEESVELSPSVLFEILTAAPRRHVIEYLLTAENAVPLREITDYVIAQDGGPAGGPSPAARNDVRTALQHAHLPKLVETGVVTYDPSARTVAPTPSATAFEPYLALASDFGAR